MRGQITVRENLLLCVVRLQLERTLIALVRGQITVREDLALVRGQITVRENFALVRGWRKKKKKPNTYCLRMFSFPRISENLQYSMRHAYERCLPLTTLCVDDDE